jgi:hypothetical protein
MSPRSPHFSGIFWLSLSACAGLSACGDSGGPAQPSLEEEETCDAVFPTSCELPAPSYEKDVKGIFAARCATSTCHDGRGEQWPLVDYAHVADWASEVRAMVGNCAMPPPDSEMEMPTEERQVILQWVRCNTPE